MRYGQTYDNAGFLVAVWAMATGAQLMHIGPLTGEPRDAVFFALRRPVALWAMDYRLDSFSSVT